jgi:L-alanine-DL-glutamate epimerase-like enolase superfamily enzyme
VSAPAFRLREVELFERDVKLRLPFRFGVVTLTECPQLFARARIETTDGRSAWGMAAEMLAPKWFDKNLALTNEDNFDQLRLATKAARELYLGDRIARTAFGFFSAHYRAQIDICKDLGLNALIACYGPALLDRAMLDALCRAEDVSFYDAMQRNLSGIEPSLVATDLQGFDFGRFLASRQPAAAIAARHTVGLVDPITDADAKSRINDGLPETLEEVVATYGHTWFKLKVGGDIKADIERLSAIAAVLDRGPAYSSTLDGNEQYDDVDAVIQLWRAIEVTPTLKRLAPSVIFIEQPIKRQQALSRDVKALAALKPVIIDESDDTLDVFPRARDLGYAGISSKTCKGLYKSLINAARVQRWGHDYLMSAEDLTTQAGICVQQDLALVNFIGLTHVERNGHHYVDGFAGAPPEETERFFIAHPDLYHRSSGKVRLKIMRGQLAIGSLAGPGFAVGTEPDWRVMRPMPQPRPSFITESVSR